jgi:hypothetical protein
MVNRTRDLPACSMMPQPTTLPRALIIVQNKIPQTRGPRQFSLVQDRSVINPEANQPHWMHVSYVIPIYTYLSDSLLKNFTIIFILRVMGVQMLTKLPSQPTQKFPKYFV